MFSEPDNVIRVRGARVHNLRGVDADLPRQRVTVITGVSGSGKSSLAFDTIHAESQRRYLESLAAETRSRVATGWQRPDVDVISGLPPTISVEQSAGSASLRTTLATTTEILDYLRLLFARCGQAHCPQCGRELAARSTAEIVQQILRLEAGRKVMILAPLVRGKKGAHREVFESIAKLGFVRIRVDGDIVEASQPPTLAKTKSHTIEAIVDRIVVKDGLQTRLRESVELALKHGSGTCLLSLQAGSGWEDHAYSSRFACADCGVSFAELEPRTFSFNSPFGACLSCRGLGVVSESDRVDQDELAAQQSDRVGVCLDCDGTRLGPFARGVVFGGMTLPAFLRLNVTEALATIRTWQAIAQRSRLAPVSQTTALLDRTLPSIRSRLEFLQKVGADYLTLDRPTRSLSGGEFQRARLAACLGSGLTGACYVLDEPTVGLHPKDTAAMIDTLHELRDRGNTLIVVEHDPDVMRQADYLIDLGPGAGADGGLVVACGSPAAVGQDERSVTGRFLGRGNVAVTAPRDEPLTADVEIPRSDRSESNELGSSRGAVTATLTLRDVRVHNLQNVTVQIPLQRLTAITGVSGSGKTSLVHHALVPAVRETLELRQRSDVSVMGRTNERVARPEALRRACPNPRPFDDSERATSRDEISYMGMTELRITGIDSLARLIEVTQTPISRSPASNPATYSGLWDEVCRLFAQTREAKLRGFRASRFKFNSPSGRCETCRGRGVQRVRMQPLPDAFVTCPACRGDRFNGATLQVRYRGLSAADILRTRIEAAAELFTNIPKVAPVLKTFVEVGLGYLQLGQSAMTLSGGEAQRVKLATELSRERPEPTLFVLDEPTTGLHPADVERLLSLLRCLVIAGHTVVVIEHHLSVIAAADWLIDLGPEGGSRGGRIVAEGTPADVAQRGEGHTAAALTRVV